MPDLNAIRSTIVNLMAWVGEPQLQSCGLFAHRLNTLKNRHKLECGTIPNLIPAVPNIGGALCSTPQSLADAHYLTAVQ